MMMKMMTTMMMIFRFHYVAACGFSACLIKQRNCFFRKIIRIFLTFTCRSTSFCPSISNGLLFVIYLRTESLHNFQLKCQCPDIFTQYHSCPKYVAFLPYKTLNLLKVWSNHLSSAFPWVLGDYAPSPT